MMSFSKIGIFTKFIYRNSVRRISYKTTLPLTTKQPFSQWRTSGDQSKQVPIKLLAAAGLFSFFQKDVEEETPEQKLIMTIKRSILCIQREEYDKAEKMLHLALKMAQDLQNKGGITYVYDVMANLAMEREQFAKAEKLFVEVMKRLFADGHEEDSDKMLHISAKIAHMAQIQGHAEKALQGFKWTLEKLEKKMKDLKENEELKELWGLTKNWYGQLLMDLEKYVEAKTCFSQAYEVFKELHGKIDPEAIMLLNNLSVACTNLNDLQGAKEYLEEALELAKELPELIETGVLKANLGVLYLKQGLLQQAKEACSLAWRLGKQMKSDDAVKQADYCLKMINEFDK